MQQRTDRATVELGELGELRLWVAGIEQPVRGDRTRAVLALLSLRGQRGASMDYLVDLVWADQPPSARRSLANVIRRLRSVMGAESIVTDGSVYRLASTVVSQRSGFLAAADKVANSQLGPNETLTIVHDASKLWRGEAWAEFDDETPLIGDRVTVREARLRLVEAAALAAKSIGDLDVAAGYLRELVKQRPHHEHWWRDLAEVVALGGDRVAALRLLQTARSTLDQVGLAPGVELLNLERRLLGVPDAAAVDGARAAARRLGNPSLRVAEDLPFVGRSQVMSQMLDQSGSTARPASIAAFIEGPAGAGKSRLVVELARQCSQHVVLSGRCEEAGWSTLGPFQQILDEYVAATAPQTTGPVFAGFETILANHVPALEHPATTPSAESALVEQRERLVLACITALRRASQHQPLILLIDDLQWASAVALDVIDELMNTAESTQLAIVATCRFDGLNSANDERVTGFFTRPGALHVSLGPLLHADLQSIVRATHSTIDVDGLLQRTGGNPFFVAEVLRTGPGQIDDATLSRVVRSRVDLVHAHAAEFLTIAALSGLEFNPWMVGEVMQLEPSTTGQLIDALVKHQLVLRRDDVGSRCVFAHGLVAEAMHSSTELHERRSLHLRIAQSERGADAPVETWVEHLLEAAPLVDRPELAELAIEAATRFAHSGRPEAAISVMRRLLACRLDVDDRVRAMSCLGGAMMFCGEGGLEAILLEASEIALREELDEALAEVALVYSRGGPWRHNNDTNGARLLQLALDRCPADRPELRTSLETRLMCFSIFSGSLDERSSVAEQAIALARESGDTEALAEATNAAILAVTCPAALARTRELEDDMVRLEDAGLARSEMSNRPAISTYWSGNGAQYRLDIEARRAKQVSATRSERWLLATVDTVLALFDGHIDDARHLLATIELDTDVAKGNHAWNTVTAEWLAGDVTKALALVTENYNAFRGAPLRYTLLWLAAEAENDELVSELRDTITPVRIARLPELYLGGFGLAGLAMTAHVLNDRELATMVEPELGLLANQMIGVPWATMPAADFFLALLAQVQGDTERANERATAAIQVHARMGAPAFDELLGRYLPGH